MPDRLHRCRLLLGEEKLAKLQRATVMVVGCGVTDFPRNRIACRRGKDMTMCICVFHVF